MEKEPDLTNVVYIDEYPELQKRIWLRRLQQERELGNKAVTGLVRIYKFPDQPDPAA